MISNVMSIFASRSSSKFALLLVGGMLSLNGCAGAPDAYRTGDHWAKDGYAWPSGGTERPQSGHNEASLTASVEAPSAHLESAPESSEVIMGSAPTIARKPPARALKLQGRACEEELSRRGVKFRTLSELKGVENPIEVRSKLGGVAFWANDGRPLQLDCRLAVALDQLGPVFQAHGVRKVRYSGAYSYRSTSSGRLSHHAYGLAIDLHEFEVGSKKFSVMGEFQRNVGCKKGIAALNSLTCDMRDQALFEEFLTPDYNHDHRDHLHISVPRGSR